MKNRKNKRRVHVNNVEYIYIVDETEIRVYVDKAIWFRFSRSCAYEPQEVKNLIQNALNEIDKAEDFLS